MSSIMQDLKLAVRSLRRSPGFTLAALLTLALGIGATAAISSVAKGVLLSPLRYTDADRIVTIWSSRSSFPHKTWVSVAEYRYYYQNNTALEDIALYQRGSSRTSSIGSEPAERTRRRTTSTPGFARPRPTS